MTARAAARTASAVVAALLVLVYLSSGDADKPAASDAPRPAPAAAHTQRSSGVVVGCGRRSEANFPGAFADSRNLVAGPLVLVGAAYTPASVVRDFGGNKFPLLLKAGHRVTLRVPREARRLAGFAYAGLGRRPLPQGRQVRLGETAHTMTFVACKPGKPTQIYRSEGPSGSYADGQQLTFWSGFVLTRGPRCLPLDVSVDDEPSPRRVGLALGRRCRGQ